MRRELVPVQQLLQSIVLLTPDRDLTKKELQQRLITAAETAKQCLESIYSLKGQVRIG